MRLVITGAFGFLGSQLTATLLQRGTFRGKAIDSLVLADRYVQRDAAVGADPRVEIVKGDLLDSLEVLFADTVDAVIHLASAVSAEAEADFDLGLAANLDTTRALLEAARAQTARRGPLPLVLFTSSVAVYGSDPALPLPEAVSESTVPTPQSSYGIQKLLCEQLMADYTRKGFLDGRVARLMTVAIRPGKPNAAASGFVSGIVREPLAGIPATCPVGLELEVALASPSVTVEGIVRVAERTRDEGADGLGRIPVNLPAVTVTVGEILTTLRRVAGDAVADLVTVSPDPRIEAIVGSWPARFDNTRAVALGLDADPDFESIVRQYLADHAEAVTADTITDPRLDQTA